MTFYEIEFPLAALDVSEVEEALLRSGANSITFVDRGDEPVLEPKPGEFRLWSDTLVRALFQESDEAQFDAAANLDRLAAALGPHVTHTARVRAVEDQVWERAWLKDWKSTRFGRRLWVVPHDAETPREPQDAVVVRLDPGLAFGTGTHATTALCLEVLDGLSLAGRTVIDYGCGSGILGIAALKLGAAHVAAVDVDPQALMAARDNAIRNGVAAKLTLHDGQDELGTAYCVVANILAGPLIELAPRLKSTCEPGGCIVLSGVLKTQEHEVAAAYAEGFGKVRSIERDGWCCLYAWKDGL